MKVTIILSMLVLFLTGFFPSNVAAQDKIKVVPNTKILSKNWNSAVFTAQTEVLQFINGEKGNAPSEFRIASVPEGRNRVRFYVFYQSGLPIKPKNLWQTKAFGSADETLNFINAQPGKEFRISGSSSTLRPQTFFVFYREIAGSQPQGWGWKLSETADDAKNFLSREGGYTDYIRDAEIAAIGTKFYIFYLPAKLMAPPPRPFPSWGWVKRETTESAVDILNKGTTNVVKMMTTARVAAIIEPPNTVFYIFYQ